METVKVSKGRHFLRKGERLKGLFVVLQGSVRAVSKNDEIQMEAGSIVGLLESASSVYLCDYITNTDCVFYVYPYRQTEDYKKIFASDEKYVAVFTMGAMHQAATMLDRYGTFSRMAQNFYSTLMDYYAEYKKLCNDYQVQEKPFQRLASMSPAIVGQAIEKWTVEYYDRMSTFSLKFMDQFLGRDYAIGIGEIQNAASWMVKALTLIEKLKEYLKIHKELLLAASSEDLFQMYFELARKASGTGMDMEPIFQKISEIMEYAKGSRLFPEKLMDLRFAEYGNYNFHKDTELGETDIWVEEDQEEYEYEEGVDYLEQILSYAQYDAKKAETLRDALQAFKDLPDRLATTDDVRKLRKQITQDFYDIYELAFYRSLQNDKMPPAVKMFLNFGFMDEELAGSDNTRSLYDLTQELSRCRASNVFTIYEWLLSIYRGENEPSRNEFDMDFANYLSEQKKTGQITAAQMSEMAADTRQKVDFELKNMFVSTNRATYGKFSTYCPVLCEDDIIGTVENMLITAEKANNALNMIRGIDFSLFYREVGYSDPEHDINMEMIQKEVLPNIILMPNAGNKAMMWQETAGIKKDTSARFVFPIFTVVDVEEMMIEVSGRFRWEMCRKIQGVRWNDITEASLTSEYNDYIQYYRKNHDLSPDAKQKVKNALTKAKNNFREVFVKDYQSWIRYEAKGSFRLNKVSRDIIFRYCPFNKEIRNMLRANPMYREMFEKYEILKERKKRHIELWYERYKKKGGEINEELQTNWDFYDM
ncbi:cyclic nucleotide-binding domain-containing protein [Lachnospiraceae bacterium]|nr:cyclic nucleotide-binding domain-containing protein [Lachnospiraceae bacterium]